MLNIEKVDTDNKKQVKRFVELPYRIYANCLQWVPPLNVDAYNQLNRKKHPFHEHSEVEFFLAVRDGRAGAAQFQLAWWTAPGATPRKWR